MVNTNANGVQAKALLTTSELENALQDQVFDSLQQFQERLTDSIVQTISEEFSVFRRSLNSILHYHAININSLEAQRETSLLFSPNLSMPSASQSSPKNKKKKKLAKEGPKPLQKVCDDFDAADFLKDPEENTLVGEPVDSENEISEKEGAISDEEEVIDEDETAYAENEDSNIRKRVHDEEEDGEFFQISKKQAPKKKKTRTGYPPFMNLNPEEQRKCDEQSLMTGDWRQGCRVLCRWPDKCFYPAHVVSELNPGRYKVRYLDNVHKDLYAHDMITVASLEPGDEIMAKQAKSVNGDIVVPVRIVKTPCLTDNLEWYDGVFAVKNAETGAEEKVCWQDFIIDATQTKDFIVRQTKINRAAHDVST